VESVTSHKALLPAWVSDTSGGCHSGVFGVPSQKDLSMTTLQGRLRHAGVMPFMMLNNVGHA
jgi:hypothetical protein